jgi:hypothetical protein
MDCLPTRIIQGVASGCPVRTPLTLLFVGLTLLSCTRVVAPPQLEPGEPRAPHEAWARVLDSAVDDRGRVNFARIARNPHDLYLYLDHVANISPTSYPEQFPAKADKLAYYINSYNALAMYGIIVNGVPEGFDGFFDRVQFFKFTEYRVGGESISLYDYENDIIRPLGEPRVHFALNCMSVGCPRLKRTPFLAERLDQQLGEAAREFFNSETHVQVDPEKRRARLSEILDFYREDFVNEREAPSLLAYVNRHRRDRIPDTFQIEFIPYDWSVAKQ